MRNISVVSSSATSFLKSPINFSLYISNRFKVIFTIYKYVGYNKMSYIQLTHNLQTRFPMSACPIFNKIYYTI